MNHRGASNVCKLHFKTERLVRVPQHRNTNTSYVPIPTLAVQEAFAYEYTTQGPLSSPKRTSEPSGWFLDGWVQAQRSQKSQTHKPHANQQPAAM